MTCLTCGGALLSEDLNERDMSTLVGYQSPPGHDHDDNCVSRTYLCADGHVSRLRRRPRCPVEGCEWRSKRPDRCTTCKHAPLVDEWPLPEEGA